ncbi:MAG: hypothetical protein Q8R91_02350 [Candidatus Omnitrophota bacterium]|nr:hypothetical protein [Candidatus Omnitrophota bacterium]
MSTVWLLGAGASAGSDQCLPLGAELLDAILKRDTWDWPSEQDRQMVAQFIRTFQCNGVNADIEDCLTYLDCALSDMGNRIWQSIENVYAFRGPGWNSKVFSHDRPFAPTQELPRIKAILTQQVASVLLGGSHELCEKHAQMFAALEEADHIITLNYDLIAENTIEHLKMRRTSFKSKSPGKKVYKIYSDVDPGYDSRPKTGHVQRLQELLEEKAHGYTDNRWTLARDVRELAFGSIYHLHGAVNWFSCSDVSCPNHSRVLYCHDLAEIRMPGEHICACCGSLLEPVIIPPTMLKDYGRFPKIRLMWQLASLALSSYTDLVIVGCSFRQADFYLHHLIRSSLQEHQLKTVTFVGRGSETTEALKRFLGFLSFPFPAEHIIRFDGGLDEYVSILERNRNRTKASSGRDKPRR